jgi:hypothetical protein
MELNKKYILMIINFVVKINTPNNKQTNSGVLNPNIPNITNNMNNTQPYSQYKKIKIHPEEAKQSITYEDIHNDRMMLFEKELNQKQEEFTSAMTLPKPPVPNFSDKLDQPISEIEVEIKKIQEQRNYDIEIINNTNKNSSSFIENNWLKPQETSVKNEKLHKHISWEDETERNNDIEEVGIFKKLKKLTTEVDNSYSNIDNNYTDFNNNIIKSTDYQSQINDLKKDMSIMNEKLDLILEKLKK